MDSFTDMFALSQNARPLCPQPGLAPAASGTHLVPLRPQLGQQLVEQHHLAAGLHQLLELGGSGRAGLQPPPLDVLLQPVAQKLWGCKGGANL